MRTPPTPSLPVEVLQEPLEKHRAIERVVGVRLHRRLRLLLGGVCPIDPRFVPAAIAQELQHARRRGAQAEHPRRHKPRRPRRHGRVPIDVVIVIPREVVHDRVHVRRGYRHSAVRGGGAAAALGALEAAQHGVDAGAALGRGAAVPLGAWSVVGGDVCRRAFVKRRIELGTVVALHIACMWSWELSISQLAHTRLMDVQALDCRSAGPSGRCPAYAVRHANRSFCTLE